MQSWPWWEAFARWVDDLSCLAFCIASTVTIQFWTLHIITGGMVERSSDRPEWLGFAVHVLNSVLAWLDILLGRPRSFSPRGRSLCLLFVGVYSTMICACRCGFLVGCTSATMSLLYQSGFLNASRMVMLSSLVTPALFVPAPCLILSR
jgi:hypothetical protein